MILTRRGWHRAPFARRCRQREDVKALPVAFSCNCAQDGCGGIEVVTYRGLPLCRACGRPRQNQRGDYYGLAHSSWCHHSKEDV